VKCGLHRLLPRVVLVRDRFDTFQLASFTFAPIADDAEYNNTLQWMSVNIADTWKGKAWRRRQGHGLARPGSVATSDC
jgi:hypothetical protein